MQRQSSLLLILTQAKEVSTNFRHFQKDYALIANFMQFQIYFRSAKNTVTKVIVTIPVTKLSIVISVVMQRESMFQLSNHPKTFLVKKKK